jgi:hypothetical protein
VTQYRVKLKTPDWEHQFKIHNGGVSREFIWWEFSPEWESLRALQGMDETISCYPKLSDVLRLVGSHATLWIGEWEGKLAPMDVQPEGWSYPNGVELEPEWWWQWHPAEATSQKVVEYLNKDVPEAWESFESTPFKAMIPHQLQRKHGDIFQVEAIPVQRLPGLVRRDVEWVFEFERRDVV